MCLQWGTFYQGLENPLSRQLAHMAGGLVLWVESPAGTGDQAQELWFLATCVSHGFLGLCHCIVAEFQERVSQRDLTAKARPFLTKTGKLPRIISTVFHGSTWHRVPPRFTGWGHSPHLSIGGVSKDSYPTNLPMKAVSSHLCFCATQYKLLRYPKLICPLSVVRNSRILS